MPDPTDQIKQLETALQLANQRLDALTLELQINKIHLATMTGLIGDAMPERVGRMIQILAVAEAEAGDELHAKAFQILRESLEHAFRGKHQPGESAAKESPAWLRGVIDGRKSEQEPD